MTTVLLERKPGHAELEAAQAYLQTHGFPRQNILAPRYCFTEMVKAYPFLVPHSSGGCSDERQGALYTFILEEFVGTIEALQSEDGWLIETTIYGPGVVTGPAIVQSGHRRRAVRI